MSYIWQQYLFLCNNELFLAVSFITLKYKLYLALLLSGSVNSILTVQVSYVRKCHVITVQYELSDSVIQYELFLVVSFITVQY